MKEAVCKRCGGDLIQRDSVHWQCAYCDISYIADRDEEGYAFFYRPIERKTLKTGQISQKASAIRTHDITIREIKVNDDIEREVAEDINSLSKSEAVKVVEAYLTYGEYEKAQGEINRYLAQDKNCAEILWYSVLCKKRFNIKEKHDGEKAYYGKLTPFSEDEAARLDRALANASPQFAKTVMDCCFDADFSDDASCERILGVCVPYVPNESVYSIEERRKIFERLFETVITEGFEKSFDYLLNTVEPSRVDDYIDLNLRFAEGICKQNPSAARKYWENVLSVESGNAKALRRIVETDLLYGEPSLDESLTDLERYLGFSDDPDETVLSVFDFILRQSDITAFQSQFVRRLIEYHSAVPHGLKDRLLAVAYKLLRSSLFGEASDYFYLILSFDKKCRDAFFGLCLVRIKATDRNDVVNKNDLLKDCPEFSKCIALSDKADIDAIYALSRRQEERIAREAREKQERKRQEEKDKEDRRRTRREANAGRRRVLIKLGIIIGVIAAIIIAIVISVASCNAARDSEDKANRRKHSLDNIEMTVTKKTAGTKNSSYYDGIVVALYFDIYNKSTVDVTRIDGEMGVYRGESDLLMNWNVAFSNVTIRAGEKNSLTLNCDARYSDKMVAFYDASLEELKITFTISYVHFSDGYDNKNDKKTVKIVKPYYPQEEEDKKREELEALETKYQNALSLMQQGRYDEAYQAFRELGNYKDSAEKTEEAKRLSELAKKEAKYQNALSLMQQGKYDEAYQAFRELGDYKDSAEKMEEAKRLSELAKKEEIYQSALSMLEQQRYKEAYELFYEIYEYKDSADKMLEIFNTLAEIAQAYADGGHYSSAYETMLEIGITVDAWKYASQGNWQKAVESGLTEIVVSDGTTAIKNGAFSGCYGLKRVTLPSSLEIIEADAFRNCYGLLSVTIPQNVYSIGDGAFYGCYKLVEVYDLSDDLEIIKQSQYFGRVAYYAKDVFTNANEKSHISVDEDGFVFYDNDDDIVLLDYVGDEEDITLPTVASGKQYKIQPYAFYENAVIRNIVIPDCVVEIGDYAFNKCGGLSQVTVGDGVVTIGQYAFSSSTIESITMGIGVTTIDYYAFGACKSLASVTLGANLQTIERYAFYGCAALQRITITRNVTMIGGSAFNSTGLVYVKFEITEGWSRHITPITPSALEDPANAAKLLAGGFYDDWHRT